MSRAKRNAAAEDYFKRAPGYSAEAIEDLSAVVERCRPNERNILSWLIAAAESGHKFVLPDYGQILGETPFASLQAAASGARLPYPEVVIEFAAPTRGALGTGRVECEKRLVVCVEVPADGRAGAFSGGFMAWPFGFTMGHWRPQAFGFGIYYPEHGEGLALAAFGEHGERVGQELRDEGRNLEEFACREYATELHAVYGLLAALACTNVTTEILRPNREARAARPASTLFDYHVLVLDPSRVREPGEDRGGTHASPRTHLRRGHIRRHPTAGRIWVNQCVVAPTSIGTVNKDYRVKRPS